MSVFTIAPSTPFLPCLAGAVMDGSVLGGWQRSGPFWLSDVTIILPTQRAKRKLIDAFAERADFTGLLPDIRTFGGEEADEEPFLPPFDASPLKPKASGLMRRLILSDLVAAWAKSERGRKAFSAPPTAAEIFSMTESLGRVIDDLIIEERTATDLHAIGQKMAENLNDYWQQTLAFLDIALSMWPSKLNELKAIDAAALRSERLHRQALAVQHLYADRPVIAAGSTGSIPATAQLLKAISTLPRGAVVLPGLDMDMGSDTLADLRRPDQNPHGHPQYGLANLLQVLSTNIGDVVELCASPHVRTAVVNHALALTGDTALWAGLRPDPAVLDTALSGISIIAARNEDEEARAIALASRTALEAGKSVGIVTPDRNLARRIAAELRRFDIHVDDAAGAPLFHAPAGRLARQVLSLVVNKIAPVDLVALLRNRAVDLGGDRGALIDAANRLDLRFLRGQRPGPGFSGLRDLLALRSMNDPKSRRKPLADDEAADISILLGRLETALVPLVSLLQQDQMDAAQLASALKASVSALSSDTELQGRKELADWAGEMSRHAGEGHFFGPFGLDEVLFALMNGFEVRNHLERREDIAIWGQLEARLMSPDVLILGALNEDKWPAAADPGPWLSRGMRLAAGLEPPERMQGLAAHDFAQALGNAEVIVAYADRVGSSPALPSRLVQRFDAFIGAPHADMLRARGAVWREAAKALDAVAEVKAAPRPTPNPPLLPRMTKLSVTEVETLMRSPYDLYAKHILRLRPLDALGEDPDARERGTIIHAILARFVEEKHDVRANDALDILMVIANEEFAGLDMIGERRDIWLRRFATAASQFLDFERARDRDVRQRHAEIRGEWTLPLGNGFLITGEADRVDELKDGSLEILDFKTGSPPSPASMKGFEAPQLPLEALMAKAGAMQGIDSAPSSALTYIKIGLGPEAFKPSGFALADDMNVMEAAEEILHRMQGHIDFFLMRETPMTAQLLPLKTQRFAGPYDHLARRAEWVAVDGEDEA